MTVKELREKLEAFDDGMDVYFLVNEQGGTSYYSIIKEIYADNGDVTLE